MEDKCPYPDLLSTEEKQRLLKIAENLFDDLMENNIGGYSGINRPFWIESHFRQVIEEFGRRDVGRNWSKNQLENHPDRPL